MNNPTALVIAVVDDDHRMLESLEALLESAGYVARLYSSAAEFLGSGDLPIIHCLITDVRMPVTDGWALESIVFGTHPGLPVILISGDDLAHQEARFRRTSGRSRMLFGKPFNGPELLAAIKAATERCAD